MLDSLGKNTCYFQKFELETKIICVGFRFFLTFCIDDITHLLLFMKISLDLVPSSPDIHHNVLRKQMPSVRIYDFLINLQWFSDVLCNKRPLKVWFVSLT